MKLSNFALAVAGLLTLVAPLTAQEKTKIAPPGDTLPTAGPMAHLSPKLSKRDLAKVQAQFNEWAAETGLPYTHISRICAMSIGENYEASRLMRAMGDDEE